MQATLMGTLLNASGVSQGQIPVAVDASGKVYTNGAAGDSTALLGTVRIDQATPGTTNGVAVNRMYGAANLSTGQMIASTVASTFVPARPTRRSVTLRNIDATNSVFVGPATITSLNGMLLRGGESLSVTFTGLIQVISGAGSPVVSYADEYETN